MDMYHTLCRIDWDKVVSVLSALLTPLIAIVTTCIAYQQYITNRRQLRLALFEKRYNVFSSTAILIAVVIQTSQVANTDITAFDIGTRDRDFLFGTDIAQYLEQVRNHAVDLLAQVTLPANQQNPVTLQTLRDWFHGQIDEARRRFGNYVAFTEG